MPTLSIVIPVYNEAKTGHLILNKIRAVSLINDTAKELIIVNDCSTDTTSRVIREYISATPGLDIKFYEHTVNQGKGAALHTGINHATGDYIIIQDADLEYDPADYNGLLRPMIDGVADVVFGSRFMGGKPH